MTDAERNKMIARMMREGRTDEEIKAAMRSPMQSFWEGSFMKDATTAAGNVGSGLLNVAMKALQPLGAAGTGMAHAVKEPSKTMKPVAFVKGAAGHLKDSVMDPNKEQLTVSKALGRPDENTWSNLGIDMLTDPTTYMGAGLLRNGLKQFGKQAVKGGMAATAATTGLASTDKADKTMAPLGMVGALAPDNWSKIPKGFYSALEREIEALGKKQMTAIHAGKTLKARPTIKPDEWRDVGMDDILASKQEWNPVELLEAVRQKRPSIAFDEGQQWRDNSTAKEQDKLPGWIDRSTYKATQLRQKGLNFQQPHWGQDTVAHLRSDVATTKNPRRVQIEKQTGELIDASRRARDYGDKESIAGYDQDIYNLFREDAGLPKNRKDYLVNEVQSDLHQAANKKVTPQPDPTNYGSNGEESMFYKDDFAKWNALSPDQKQAKVGYRTPENSAKVNQMQGMLDRSVFNEPPSRSRSILDATSKVSSKTGEYFERVRQGKPATVPKSARRVPEVARVIGETKVSGGEPLHHSVLQNIFRKYKQAGQIPRTAEANPMVRQIDDWDTMGDKYAPYDNANIGANKGWRSEEDAWAGMLKKRSNIDSISDDSDYMTALNQQTYDEAFTPSNRVAQKIGELQKKPPAEAVSRKTWPNLMMKKALQDAVEGGADRFGVLDADGVGRILQDEGGKQKRRDWYDKELPQLLEGFLRSQGVTNAKFGAKEPFREDFAGRFMELTPEIKELVKKGMPLYAAIAAVKANQEQ